MNTVRMKLVVFCVVATVLQIALTEAQTETSTPAPRQGRGFLLFGKWKFGVGNKGGWNNKGNGGGHNGHNHGNNNDRPPRPWMVKWGGKKDTDRSCWVYVEADENNKPCEGCTRKPHVHAQGEKHEHASSEKHGSSEEKQKENGQAGRGFALNLMFGPGMKPGGGKGNKGGGGSSWNKGGGGGGWNKGGKGNQGGGKENHHHHHHHHHHKSKQDGGDRRPRGYWKYDESKCNHSEKSNNATDEQKPETTTVTTTDKGIISTQPPPAEEIQHSSTIAPPPATEKEPGTTLPPPDVKGKETKEAELDEDPPEAKDGDMVPDYSGSDESGEKSEKKAEERK